MFSLSLRSQNHHTTACRLGHFIYVLHQCQREEKKCESTFFPTRKNDCHKKEPLVIGKRKLCKIPITAQKSTQHFLPWKKKRISCWARVSNKWPKGLCEWNQMTRIKCTQLSDKMDIWLALSLSPTFPADKSCLMRFDRHVQSLVLWDVARSWHLCVKGMMLVLRSRRHNHWWTNSLLSLSIYGICRETNPHRNGLLLQ